MKSGLMFAVVCIGMVGLSGCGGGGPRLVPVSGTVTLNGKPLEGASIAFTPDSSNKEGQPGTDITGPEGNYKAMTRGRSGLVPGKYKVTITKTPTVSVNGAADFKDDPYMAKLSQGPDDAPRAKKSASSDEVRAEFDREVPPEGGPQDFDVKAAAAKPAADTKAK